MLGGTRRPRESSPREVIVPIGYRNRDVNDVHRQSRIPAFRPRARDEHLTGDSPLKGDGYGSIAKTDVLVLPSHSLRSARCARSRLPCTQADTAEETWAPLFNGKDLDGFAFHLGKDGVDNAGTFIVRDGTIIPPRYASQWHCLSVSTNQIYAYVENHVLCIKVRVTEQLII